MNPVCPHCGCTESQKKGRRSTGTFRRRCNGCGRHFSVNERGEAYTAINGVEASKNAPQAAWTWDALPSNVPEGDKFVITWAQNATPVEPKTWARLTQYAEHNGATLVVIPGRYKNPTSHWSRQAADEDWWDPAVMPYVTTARVPIGNHCIAYGDVRVSPTAITPLTGLEVFAGPASAIVGHPKVQLQSVPSGDRSARVFATTGACTRKNYTQSKAGVKGHEHHIFGAVVVERDGDLFHLRHLIIDKQGELYDLCTKYNDEGVWPNQRPESLVLGDVHVAKLEEQQLESTEDILRVLKPRTLVLHDVLDFDARNYHSRKNLKLNIMKAFGHGLNSVQQEVWEACIYVQHLASLADNVYVVRSNHDEAFDRAINDVDPRTDPPNAPFYYQTLAAMATAASEGRPFNAFQHWFDEWFPDVQNVKFLARGEELKILGVAHHFHGDTGINGARGSLNQYSRLGTKATIGHSHSPGIRDGAYQVGVTARLDQGYNHLPSSWLNAHCILYPNGRRTLINVINGRWRA